MTKILKSPPRVLRRDSTEGPLRLRVSSNSWRQISRSLPHHENSRTFDPTRRSLPPWCKVTRLLSTTLRRTLDPGLQQDTVDTVEDNQFRLVFLSKLSSPSFYLRKENSPHHFSVSVPRTYIPTLINKTGGTICWKVWLIIILSELRNKSGSKGL